MQISSSSTPKFSFHPLFIHVSALLCVLHLPLFSSLLLDNVSSSSSRAESAPSSSLLELNAAVGVPKNEPVFIKPPINAASLATQAGTIWPLPQKLHYGVQNRTIRRGSVVMQFRGGQRDVDCDILENAKNTYLRKWLFPSRQHIHKGSGTNVNLVVKLRKRCPSMWQFPDINMNEEYRLMVPFAGDIVLEADEIWGILRGLETFSQLFFYQQDQYYLRTGTIHDWPEYPVRGVLLDTSRHFLQKNLILRQIDLMAQNKMNTLHWHIVDMESFPYVSKAFPNISRMGAFTPMHVYSPAVVEEVIQHARLRGVRVVPEFDTPGHMASWLGSGILADCRDQHGHLVAPSMLDPTRESTYAFLKEFFREVLTTFHDQYVHLGGDETTYWTDQCWGRNPEIRAFMAHMGMANITQLENYYFRRLQLIVKELFGEDRAKKMIVWQEVFDHNKPDNVSAIVHNWYSRNDVERNRDVKRAVEQGFQVLVSSCWYLNLINYGADWRQAGLNGLGKYYYCNPRAFNGTYAEKQLVLGGIATMWGEYIDGTNLEATLWPRASAVAERLWSPPEMTKSADEAWPRLQEHRCRMVARGYRAEPVNGPDYCLFELDEPM